VWLFLAFFTRVAVALESINKRPCQVLSPLIKKKRPCQVLSPLIKDSVKYFLHHRSIEPNCIETLASLCMYVCTYKCMYVCMYVYIYIYNIYIYTYIHTYI